MLKKENRLPSNTRLHKSIFFKAPLFAAKVADNGLPNSRCAFLVKKTVDKRAVVRNRIRRVFRSCVEELFDQMVEGKDMLFFLEKGIIDERQEDLRKDLRSFFRKKSLLKEEA